MSKLGKKPIAIPEGVAVSEKNGILEVKGKNATLNIAVLPGVKVEVRDGSVLLTVSAEKSKQILSNWGTLSAHLRNAIAGATADFKKELSIVGVGFKAAIEGGKDLVLSVGYSHPIRFPIPAGVKIVVEKNNITISGSNRWLVGETAAKIRETKKPEPYQGKGIRYKDEIVRKKAGKKAAAKAGPAAK